MTSTPRTRIFNEFGSMSKQRDGTLVRAPRRLESIAITAIVAPRNEMRTLEVEGIARDLPGTRWRSTQQNRGTYKRNPI